MTPEEKDELFRMLRDIQYMIHEDYKIAKEYRDEIGRPWREFTRGLRIIRQVIVWVIGALLTFVGLKEAWDTFIGKHWRG